MDATNNKAAPDVQQPQTIGQRATEILWREVDAELGLLTAPALSLHIGSGTADPGLVIGLYREGRLIAMHRAGQILFPGFQLQRGSGVVQPVIRDLRQAAGSAGTDQALISWLVTSSAHLDGVRPVDILGDSERVLTAARKSFGRW